LKGACRGGNLRCVKLLVESWKLQIDDNVLNCAIRFYWEDIVHYLLTQNLIPPGVSPKNFFLNSLKLATSNSQLRIIKLLIQFGAETSPELLGHCKHLDIVKWYLYSGAIKMNEENLSQFISETVPSQSLHPILLLFIKYWVYWIKIRLLFIGKADVHSSLYLLPIEVIKNIAKCLKYFV